MYYNVCIAPSPAIDLTLVDDSELKEGSIIFIIIFVIFMIFILNRIQISYTNCTINCSFLQILSYPFLVTAMTLWTGIYWGVN